MLHLAPHISKEDDRGDRKRWGGEDGAEGVWVGTVGGGGVVCCRFGKQTGK